MTQTIGALIDVGLAVPYLPGGRDLNGWDCWGAVRWLYAQHTGVWLPEYPSLSHDESRGTQRAAKKCLRYLQPCNFGPWVFAAQYRGNAFTHIGLVLPNRSIFHATEQLWQTTTHRRRAFEMLSLTTKYYRWIPC
jgi:cell wall-associated NlpC family hydrolase